MKAQRTDQPQDAFQKWVPRAAAVPLGITASAFGVRAGSIPLRLAMSKAKDEKELTERLLNVAKKKGISPRMAKAKPAIHGPGAYHPLFDAMYLSDKTRYRPSVVAHELGHARDFRGKKGVIGKMMRARGLHLLGRWGGLAGAALAPEQYSMPAAGVGTAMNLPLLAMEAKASHYGGKMLSKALKNPTLTRRALARVSPYIGMPTYVAAASMPLMAAGIRKKLKKYIG